MLQNTVIVLFTATIVASKTYDLNNLSEGRIVGGKPVSIENHPWQLSFQYKGSHNCGASIISSKWALTAAHCLHPIELLSFRSGSSFHANGGTIHNISRIIPHEKYNPDTIDYDIAVVEVKNLFDLNSGKVSSIKLPISGSSPPVGAIANVTGWGLLKENGNLADQLQEVSELIVGTSACESIYGKHQITDRMLCAGNEEGGKGSCTADSGGPLIINNTVYGVVSYGIGCARPNIPGVYAHVGNLRSWIKQKTGI